MAERGDRPIADYAIVGDCHGAALVAKDGSVDWCCLERFDSDPLFMRLLDARRGGFLWIRPRGEFTATRAYLPHSNVLRTELATPAGRIAVTDWMPLGRTRKAGANDYVTVCAPGWLVRRIEALEGSVDLEIGCRATLDYGARIARLTPHGRDLLIEGTPHALRSDFGFSVNDDHATATLRLEAGERRYVAVTRAGDAIDSAAVDHSLAVTRAFWSEWIGYCRYDGPYVANVERSALALKLLTYAPTGACVAASTTSLPEEIGGERNWDYRFCWIRDASLMLHALSMLGYSSESHRFWDFLCERMVEGVAKLQVMYAVDGGSNLEERVLDLAGYRGSKPVRIGNAAHAQRQLDLYGYIFEGGFVYEKLGADVTRGDRKALEEVANFIEEVWNEPDTGIWESRGPLRHYVHSKAMCWVVLDRAVKLLGAAPRWVELRDRIFAELCARGRVEGHFVQSMDEGDPRRVDAALLQLATLGLPIDHDTLRATRLAVEKYLARGDFLERYTTEDGVPGGEGAFLICSFWHVDALLAEGEERRARELFERLLACANDVGLFSEEIDPASGALLGNFPQAFTHLGLVNSAVNLQLHEKHGKHAVARQGYAERAHRIVKATFGLKGAIAALGSRGRVRIVGSRASILDMETLRPPAKLAR
jgi:alpha,alpha-trehalase